MEQDFDISVEDTYSFGIPGTFIWALHIIIGIILAYLGYNILNQQPINNNIGILLLIVGASAIFYHSHLWYLHA